MAETRIRKTLSNFGLSANEITVYLEAVKHNQISPFKLAQLTGIPRTTVYDVMMTLALKGLITIKNNQGLEKQQSWIVAENPSKLRDIIGAKRKELTQLEVDVVDILPDLKGNFLAHENNSFVQVYPGVDGIKHVYKLLREVPSEAQVYFFDHMMPMDTLGKEYINMEVSQTLHGDHKGKRVKALMPLNDWTRHVLTYQFGRSEAYIDHFNYRFIDQSTFNLEHDMYIFLDKVIIICAKADELWAAVISSNLVASSLRAIFETLWQIAQPVTKEFVISLGENEFLQAEKRSKKPQ